MKLLRTLLWAAPRSLQLAVIWRIVGFAMLLLAWRTIGDHPWTVYWQIYPPEFHAMTAAALALVLVGPRTLVLLTASAAWIALLRTVHAGDHLHLRFIADEYLVFAALPGIAGVSAMFSALEHRDADPPLAEVLARAQLWHLRLFTLVTLGFGALHKVNVDFLDPAVSCVAYVERELVALWSVPTALLPAPLPLLLLEGLTPLLLLLWPRLGIVCAVALATGLGHAGPFAFNALLLGMALAFLPADAVALWSSRWRWLLLIFVPLATLAAWTSATLYRGRESWWPYLVFDLLLALIVALVAVTLRSESWRARVRPLRRDGPWLPGHYAHRSLCVYTALILIANGLSPYLGLKYRHSFAMVSNLRADDSRWNSLVFPRWMRLRGDPLVHVEAVYDLEGDPLELPGSSRARLLRVGVYSPQEFRRRHEDAQRRRIRATIKLRYRGSEHVFTDYTLDSAMQRFVAALPEERLFQDALTLDSPQKCVH